jgi:hypothetical protein
LTNINWKKLKQDYPKAHEEIKIIHELTGKIGADLLDQYFDFHNKERFFMRLPILQEIENNLK